MIFQTDFESMHCGTHVSYFVREYSFNYSTVKNTDIVLLIDCLEMNADSETGIIHGVKGFHAHTMWKNMKLSAPHARNGTLKLKEKCDTGMIKRILENVNTYYDKTTNWICIGTPYSNDCISVTFADNLIASIKNGLLTALWIQADFIW